MAENVYPTERVKLTLADGVERTLRYNIRTMKEASEEFGGSIMKAETLNQMEVERLPKLIWYGLRADSPDLTLETIEELLEPTMVPYVMQQYLRALNIFLPDRKNEQSPDQIAEVKEILTRAEAILAEAKSTGSISGHSQSSNYESASDSSGVPAYESSALSLIVSNSR